MERPKDQPKIVTAPPQFKDSAGRAWTLRLNLQLLDDVLSATGVDLVPEGNNVTAVTGLLLNHRQLGSVLWELCREAAKRVTMPATKPTDGVEAVPEHPLTEREFKGGLDAESLVKGWEAVVDAILFFIQSQSPGMAKAVLNLIEAEMGMVEAGAGEILATLQSDEVDVAIRQAAKRIGTEMKAGAVAQLGNFATGSQE